MRRFTILTPPCDNVGHGHDVAKTLNRPPATALATSFLSWIGFMYIMLAVYTHAAPTMALAAW